MLPDVWLDEEHLEGYPFKVQAVSGGTATPAKPHLTGSLAPPRRVLTGSIRRVQLTGSIKRGPHLTGSVRSIRYGNKKR
jgi:hypothetical protein